MKPTYFLFLFITNSLQQFCGEYETCNDCIQSSIDGGCDWCYQQNYTLGTRCFHSKLNHNCNKDFVYSHLERSYENELINDKNFMDVINPDNENEAVQIKPQRIRIKIIPNTPTSFTFKYRLAKNYPLDLYYLTDLTLTMEPDISTLSSLGTDLTNVLQNLTKYYKVAYGYYSDKVAMPFSKTTPDFIENPCRSLNHKCQMAFDFVHVLNFTENVNEFIEKVNASRTTANIDNLEGGMEALLQVILCQKFIKWKENSRKIVVIATDGTMHFAGDGKLAGVVRKNNGKCALDNKGLYTKSLLYDYPSLEQIHRELIRNKISVLFAVKERVYDYYRKLNREIPELTYVGKLQQKSENVLELVKEGYMKVIRTAKFTWNTIEGLNISLLSTCNKKADFYYTDTCEDMNLGEEYTFKVDLEINSLPKDRNMDILVIEEQDIAEKLVVEIEYLGKCTCDYQWENSNEKNQLCSNHGEFICGKCNCQDEWKGETCEKPCSEESINECREINATYTSSTCYLHGECNCGQCICDYDFMGKYCQYNQCARNRYGEICSGPMNGECQKSKCICLPHTTGEDCSCPLSNGNCKVPGALKVCNDVGECVCGKCKCPPPYTGEFCEFCPECTGLCTNYEKCVLDIVKSEEKPNICPGNDTSVYQITFVTSEPEGENKCFQRFQQGETYCDIHYLYHIKKGVGVELEIFKDCRQPIQASVLVGLIIGGILAGGLIILLLYKAKIWREERLEYQRFEREVRSGRRAIGENPLYKSPITTYTVPTSFMEET